MTDIYYTYAPKQNLLDIGVKEDSIFEDISEIFQKEKILTGLNQAELTYEQCAALIPVGEYCYSVKTLPNGKVVRITCPFWDKIVDFPSQNNGYCHFRKQGDWQMGSIGLLWDQCKCCGINETPEEDLILE